MERITILNSNGLHLAAVIHRPITKTKKLAILCPGYLDTKDYQHLVMLADALAERGYTAVRFDPTGTWESEGDISEYSVTQYLKDIESVLTHMLREGHYEHVLLGGHSRGGQVSVLYAARDPRISVVLGIMASAGPMKQGPLRNEWEETGISISKRDIPGSEEKKEFRVPYSHVLDRDLYDAVEDIKKITVPVILVAGEKDILIPPADLQVMFDAANEPKTFILMKDIGHEYRHYPLEIALVNREILKVLPT